MNYIAIPGLRGVKRIKIGFPKSKSTEAVINAVCKYFGLTIGEISTKRRFKEIVYPRQVLSYLLRRNTKMTVNEIGELFDNDHTTILNSIQKIKDLMDTEPEVKEEVREIQENI